MQYGAQGNYPAQTAAASLKQNPTISSAIEELDPVIQRAAQLAQRLHQLHARVHGPRPEEVGKDGAAPSPSALIAQIHIRRSALVSILDDMETTINGLDGGI